MRGNATSATIAGKKYEPSSGKGFKGGNFRFEKTFHSTKNLLILINVENKF
jgi:hypothetical protein